MSYADSYKTPNYDYQRRLGQRAQDYGNQQVAREFGNFVSQERFRRAQGDRARMFDDRFPRVGRSFNRRGIYDSGLRREAQQREAADFQRADDRALNDYAMQQYVQQLGRFGHDADFQSGNVDLFTDLNRRRVRDPFMGIVS